MSNWKKESWERTITKIRDSNPDNVLLEFTATCEMGNPEIAAKYHNKILFEYPLRKFREDGYSKEVKGAPG